MNGGEVFASLVAEIDTQYWLFGGATLISLAAFVGLILVPAVESYGRAWEKVAAGFLSLFVLTTMVVVGTTIGLMIFYYSNNIIDAVP